MKNKIDKMLNVYEKEVNIHGELDCDTTVGRVGGVTKCLTIWEDEMTEEQRERFNTLHRRVVDPIVERIEESKKDK